MSEQKPIPASSADYKFYWMERYMLYSLRDGFMGDFDAISVQQWRERANMQVGVGIQYEYHDEKPATFINLIGTYHEC